MDLGEDILSISTLSDHQRSLLIQANIKTTTELFTTSLPDLARRWRIPPGDAQEVLDLICDALFKRLAPQSLAETSDHRSEILSTGDALMDEIIGGGIRTGMLWEVAGESSAGKTQFGLQLSIAVQLSPHEGATAYITGASRLHTTRLLEIARTHPSFASTRLPDGGLKHVHTLHVPTHGMLLHVLSTALPDLLSSTRTGGRTPVKLIVIDALAELFHTAGKHSTETLVERARTLHAIGTRLHALASRFQVAVVIINEVTDVFKRGQSSSPSPYLSDPPSSQSRYTPQNPGPPLHVTSLQPPSSSSLLPPPQKRYLDTTSLRGDLSYANQTRFFARARTVSGEDSKEPALGIAWANHPNVRILLTRTKRKRTVSPELLSAGKRKRADEAGRDTEDLDARSEGIDEEFMLIRRMSVLFSSIAPRNSIDYVITRQGIIGIPSEENELLPESAPPLPKKARLSAHARDAIARALAEEPPAADAFITTPGQLGSHDAEEDMHAVEAGPPSSPPLAAAPVVRDIAVVDGARLVLNKEEFWDAGHEEVAVVGAMQEATEEDKGYETGDGSEIYWRAIDEVADNAWATA